MLNKNFLLTDKSKLCFDIESFNKFLDIING